MIELKDIYKKYRIGEQELEILKGITIDIIQGDYLALTGSSGSGKSTLMNILGCLDRPTSGTYRFEGQDITKLHQKDLAKIRSEKIGFVFQNFNLLPRTSALDNVTMPLLYSNLDLTRKQADLRGKELLKLVGLEDRFDHEPSRLSGGQQQRVAIARALINNPQIILADEPTGNLDTKTSEEILKFFEQLNVEHKIALVIVTHDLGIAERAKKIIKLSDGKII